MALVHDVILWLERLAHLHVKCIRFMIRKRVVDRIKGTFSLDTGVCKACIHEKSTGAQVTKIRGPFAPNVLDKVQTDIFRKLPVLPLV